MVGKIDEQNRPKNNYFQEQKNSRQSKMKDLGRLTLTRIWRGSKYLKN